MAASIKHRIVIVGGGCAPVEESALPQAKVMPQGVAWLQQAVETVDPEAREVTLDDGRS